MRQAIKQYLDELQQNLKASNATEHTHRPALQTLLQSLKNGIQVTNEPRHRTDCGAPDMVVLKTKGMLPLGHVEAKDIGISLAEVHKSEQLKRYRKYLPNLLLTDYVSFRWYVQGELWAEASLGGVDPSAGRIRSTAAQQEQVEKLLTDFLAQTSQSIRNAKALAERLARLTHMVRDIIVEAFKTGNASDILKDMREVLRQQLVPRLDEPNEPKFADLYAQTLTYGLFAARCQHSAGDGAFKLREAAREIPRTNPLLRQLFNAITGPDFDEEPYGRFVEELVAVLDNADIDKILEDFGQAAASQDPVLHFYETFLAVYDPEVRERRGVYYTPEPVVSYIVRSVDELLKSRFKIKDGLADTKKQSYRPPEAHGHPDLALPTSHRTLILDPAAGTGTFLYEVVELIRERFQSKGKAGLWSDYVHDHLLPRLFGFELLMAPYAMAHLKLGMQLAAQDLPPEDRGLLSYGFATDDRLQVYLTNTLEQVERYAQQALGSLQRAMSEEAAAATKVKRDLPILVVLGNPPYSGISSNNAPWIDGLLKGAIPDGKGGTAPTASYYHVDGKPLGEKKVWLQDDYVKFIRWAQWRLEQTGKGILAFITNHGYLDNPTFRGMRWTLMQAFDDIYLLDLHGNTKKKEVTPDGSPDQNVFDIQQGVAIGILVKSGRKQDEGKPAKVYHADLWGLRSDKYDWLGDRGRSVGSTNWERLKPDAPFFLFKPFDHSEVGDYYDWPSVNKAMPVNVTGVVTARDHFVVNFDRQSLLARIRTLRDETVSDQDIRQRYFPKPRSKRYPAGDTRGWKLSAARAQVRGDEHWDRRIVPIEYRPFDMREIYYVPWMVDWPRTEAMPHMLAGENRALIARRQMVGEGATYFFASSAIVSDGVIRSDNRGSESLFPLYLYPAVGKVDQQTFDEWPAGKDGRRPNLDPGFVHTLEQATGLAFVTDGRGDLDSDFGPEDVLAYIYAVFHWPEYRRRYEPMLKLDFPRVPPPQDAQHFAAFARLGHELLSAHLLEDEAITGDSIGYPAGGDNRVEKGFPKYVPPTSNADAKPVKVGKVKLDAHGERGRVYINPEQFFEGIEPEVWEFQIGGYQVCEKWLKDRRGRTLNYDDLTHYPRVVEALRKTIDLMQQIEQAAPEEPGAGSS